MRVITRVGRFTMRPTFWLWTVQVLLAMLFTFTGGFKLLGPADMMKGPIDFPIAFLRFLGAAELTGAFGLILPSLFLIKPRLTPLAASCLIVIMIGATVLSFMAGGAPMASLPFVTGILLSFVVYGRVRLAPLQSRAALA